MPTRPVRFLWIVAPFLSYAVNAQTFNNRYDLLDMHRAQGAWNLEQDGDSTYTVISVSSDVDSLGPDSFFGSYSIGFQRIDPFGELLYEDRFRYQWHGVTAGWTNCCDSIPGGGYVVGGALSDTAEGYSVLLMRFDVFGDTLWTRAFGATDQEWIGRQVKTTQDGGFIVVGERWVGGNASAFAIRTDANGIEEWRETYGGTAFDGFVSVMEVPDGFILAGNYTVTSANEDHWLMRVDEAGSTIWEVTWGGPFDDPNAHSCLLSNGNIAVASCRGLEPDYTLTRPYVAEVDVDDGNIVWEHQYGGSGAGTLFFGVHETLDQGLVAVGVMYPGSTQHGIMLRTDANGDSLWMRDYWYADSIVAQGIGRFHDVLPTSDGGFMVTGVAYGTFGGAYDQDTWIVRVDSMGCLVPGCDATGVTSIITNLSNALTVWPNPAHRQVQLSLQLPQRVPGEDLDVSIVAADGRVVRRVPLQGSERMVLDVQDLSAGMYTLHITQGSTWVTGAKLLIE